MVVGQAIRQRRTSYARGGQVTPEADKLRQRRTGPTTAEVKWITGLLVRRPTTAESHLSVNAEIC